MTPDDTAETSGDMWLTLHEAARAFDVSLATLHRRRKSGDLENVGAFKDKGSWKIPRQGLARLGFTELAPPETPGQRKIGDVLRDSETVSKPVSQTPSGTSPETSETAKEVQRLKDELNAALRRAEVAEAVSRERDRLINVQARELARLEAPPTQGKPPETVSGRPSETVTAPTNEVPKRSRWLRWLGA